MTVRPALKARLIAEATRCAYCGAALVDQAELAEYHQDLGSFPDGTEGYPDDWAPGVAEAVESYFLRRELLGPGPEGAYPEIDHRVPKSRGGSDEEWNLSVACGPCNQRKGARSLWAFLNEERDYFGPAPSDLLAILRPRGPFGTGSLDYHTRRSIKEIAG